MAKKANDDEKEDAKKEPIVTHEAATPAEPVAAKAPATRDPLTTIGFETGVPGQYLYVEVPEAFDQEHDDTGKVVAVHARRMLYGGANYEHTTDDADGCWIYRQM